MTQEITYKTEDRQAVFDFVARKLHEQGGSSRSGLTCVYRAPNGWKCALGHLIPDDEYIPEMECQTLCPETGTLSDGPLLKTFMVPEMTRRLVRDLQVAHDSSDIEDKFGCKHRWSRPHEDNGIAHLLKKVATTHRLSGAVVDQLWGVPE